MSDSKVPVDGDEEETPWTDAEIRWTAEENKYEKHNHDDNDDSDDDDDEGGMIDPFADPDPYDTFHFSFSKKKTPQEDSSFSTQPPPIQIDIRGCKTDSDQVWQSTGLTIWPAAQFLCEYLINHEYLLQDKKQIIELGAGLGLCGIFAHCMAEAATTTTSVTSCDDSNEDIDRQSEVTTHTTRVFVTDGDTDALVQLRENIQRNQKIRQSSSLNTKAVDHENDAPKTTTQISGHQLLWGHKTATDFVQRYGSCDAVLASDVIYVPDVIPPLFDTVKALLQGSTGGMFLMSYYSRRKVPVSIDLVLDTAQEKGFSHECLEETSDGLLLWKFELNSNE